jgi:uncharacterized RDD family membrane protein YckC
MPQQVPTEATALCSQCGRTFAQSDLVLIAANRVCGECKPAYLSRVMAGGSSATSKWHYGGFWIRFSASLIDGLIVGLAQAAIALAFFGTFGAQFIPGLTRTQPAGLVLGFQVLTYAIAITYEVTFLRYRGATPGKMATGLKVVRTNGDSLGWGVSFGRYFMKLVSAMILFIGYIMAGFDAEKRALHDRVCDTKVVYAESLANG